MLTTIQAKKTHYEDMYLHSAQRQQCIDFIQHEISNPTTTTSLLSTQAYASSFVTQSIAVIQRMMKIYRRSPSYNFSRIIQSAIIAVLLGIMFANRTPKTEGDMTSRVNSIYIAVVFIMTTSFDNVLPLFETERNLFYKHQANAAYHPFTFINALLFAEIPYIVFTTIVFCTFFYISLGFDVDVEKMFFFYLFFGLNMALWTIMGQVFISLFRKLSSAQGYGGVLVSMANLLAGVIIRPQNIDNEILKYFYWLIPSHYVVEGILTSQFDGDKTYIKGTRGSPFYRQLGCNENDDVCGTVDDWMSVTFARYFSKDNIPVNILYLVIVCTLSRIVIYIALVYLNHSRNK